MVALIPLFFIRVTESMSIAAKAVHYYFKGNTIYINIMNNLSIDCDYSGSPSSPKMTDIVILASLHPIVLDKACLDLIFNHQSTKRDNSAQLIQRINGKQGTHTVDRASKIGLGSLSYSLIDITTAMPIEEIAKEEEQKY